MKKQIITVSLLLLSSICFSQKDHYGRIKMGVYTGISLGLDGRDNNKSQQLFRSSANNGGMIGGYFRFQKRAMVLETNLSYEATATTIKLEHPQSSDVKYKNNYLQHSISHRYQMGFKINRGNPQHIELGYGMYFTHDLIRNNNFTTAHVTKIDPNTGDPNNVLAFSYSHTFPYDELRKGAFIYMQFHNEKAKSPWSLKLTYQTGPRNRSVMDIVCYYDLENNRKLVHRGINQLSPNQILLSFNLQLFNYQKRQNLNG